MKKTRKGLLSVLLAAAVVLSVLVVLPIVSSAETITDPAGVFATVKNFPTTKNAGWPNGNGGFLYTPREDTFFFSDGGDPVTGRSLQSSFSGGGYTFCKFEKSGSNYVYTDYQSNYTATFVMEDGVLQSVVVAGLTDDYYQKYNGTYAPLPTKAITNGTPDNEAAAHHGYVSVADKAVPGDPVTVTPAPLVGCAVDKVFYNDGTEHEITPDDQGVYKFTMPEKPVTVSATFTMSAWQKLQVALNGTGTSCDEFDVTTDDNGKIGIRLKADVVAPANSEALTVAEGKDVTIDLNGFALNANGKKSQHRVLVVSGKLTIDDHSQAGEGKICGGRLNPPFYGQFTEDGAGIWVYEEAELILNGGMITDNQAASSSVGGGGVACLGKFTMNGGAICHNKARWGGGIGLEKDAVFTMTGGKIYENEALTMDGSAINAYYDYSSQTKGNNVITLLGGEIYGNIANYTTDAVDDDETEGGIKAAGSAVWVEGKLILGGNIKIYGNKQGAFDDSNGQWSDLTDDANLAIVYNDGQGGDRGAGRYTVEISTEKPLEGAIIYLSQTSEVNKIVPLASGASLVAYGFADSLFADGNHIFFQVDVRNGDPFSLKENDGSFILMTDEEMRQELIAAKTQAKAALDAEATSKGLVDAETLEAAKQAIDDAETLAEVNEAKSAGMTAIGEKATKEALEAAKTAAKAALDAAAEGKAFKDPSILENAKKAIDDAVDLAAVESVKASGLQAIANAEVEEGKGGLSAGAIVGITAGSVVGAALIAYVVLFFIWKKKGLTGALSFLNASYSAINKAFFEKKG